MSTDASPSQENQAGLQSGPPPDIQANPSNPESPAGASNGRPKQSFRRRRKRRGSSGAPPANAQPAQPGQQAQPVAEGAAVNPIGAPSNTPRSENKQKKHKRFFKKNKRQGGGQGQNQGQNPGQNQGQQNAGGNGQQRRRGKQQRQPRVFVGPMDHSYRAVNGSYSDGPPSTIELQRGHGGAVHNGHYAAQNGNYNGNHAGLPLDEGESVPTIAARENGPARIYCFIDDLFFLAKIQEAARKLGIKVAFVKNDKDTVAALTELPEAERPSLIVFDLNNASAKPLTLIPKLKAKFKRSASIIGFLSHLQSELKAKAIEAGCDAVMPRSAFSQSLPNLLRRYGLEEEQTEFAEA